jgi:hypothetical protein
LPPSSSQPLLQSIFNATDAANVIAAASASAAAAAAATTIVEAASIGTNTIVVGITTTGLHHGPGSW